VSLVVAAALAVMAGALVRGYTGFGASMFWVASLSLIYPPAGVVPTVLALEVLASLTLLPAVIGKVHWRSMSWMLAATVVTMPLGVALLSVLPARPMRILVAVAILAGTLALASGVRLARSPGTRAALAAGSVSGVVNGSTGIGGPPAVLLYFSGATEHQVGRATLIAYFLGTDALGFAMMAGAGLVDHRVLLHAAIFAPLALAGIWLGQRRFARSSGARFRTVVLAVLGVLSVAMLLRALFLG
jgi:uncharacterized membrane protein YfcA